MAAGCTESRQLEAGGLDAPVRVGLPRPEGVEQPAEKQKDRQPGEESRHGDGPSLYNPMCIEKMGNIDVSDKSPE